MEFKTPSPAKIIRTFSSPMSLPGVQKILSFLSENGLTSPVTPEPRNSSAIQLVDDPQSCGAYCSNAWSCKFCQLTGMSSVMPNASYAYEGAYCSSPSSCKFCHVNGYDNAGKLM